VAVNLVITPREGAFDLAAIRHRLDSQPDTLADLYWPGAYIIAGFPSGVPHVYRKRQTDPTRFPIGVLVFLDELKILVNQEESGAEEMRSAMDFVRWLWARFTCSIREDGFADLTDEVRERGVDALYPAHVRTMPLPWDGTLIRIGFFRELDHGDGSDFSLEERRAATVGPDEEALASYLESGHVYRTVDQVARDMLVDDPDEAPLGPLRLLTDGTYVWPSDLPYYVRRYHVRLPPAFAIHARSAGFRVPDTVDLGRLSMIE